MATLTVRAVSVTPQKRKVFNLCVRIRTSRLVMLNSVPTIRWNVCRELEWDEGALETLLALAITYPDKSALARAMAIDARSSCAKKQSAF